MSRNLLFGVLKKSLALCMLIGLLSGSMPRVVDAAITGWDFEDGTTQGWMNIPTPDPAMLYLRTVGGEPAPIPIEFALTADPGTGSTWRANGAPQGGSYLIAPTPFLPNNSATDGRDGAHDAPIVLRSPTFQLTGSGQISAHILGGSHGELVVLPNNYSDLGGISSNTNGLGPTGDSSYLGMALRRDSNGDYVLHASRPNNSVSGYRQVSFDEFNLAAIAALYPDELFTIDLIDTAHGSFGSIGMDTVTVPASATSSLVAGGGMWNVLERIAPSGNVNTLALMDALLNLPEPDPGLDHTYESSVINFTDGSENSGLFSGTDFFQIGQLRFATQVTGVINVVEAGEITFGFYANDGGRLTINGNVVAVDGGADYGSPTLGSINLSAGAHSVTFEHFQNSNEATLELFIATTLGAFTSLNQATWELLVASDLEPPIGLPGDYNDDGVVNAADYVVWRDSLGANSLLNEGEGVSPGVVDGDDYNFWVTQFGNGSGGGSASAANVPEPSSLGMMALLLTLGWIGRRKCGSRFQ